MIAAGTLKYKLTFYELQNVQSESGFVNKVETEIYSCKAAKVKTTGNLDENAKEIFNSEKLIFKVRKNSKIVDNLIVKYNNDKYNILLIDADLLDNSIKITISKINK